MGIGGFFKKLGKGALEVFKSPAGDIIIGLVVPGKYRKIIQKIREIVAQLEEEMERNGYKKIDTHEQAYREAAIEAQRQGIPYKPSDLNALIEIALKELKGEAVINDPED